MFVLLVRIRENDELLTLPELGPTPQILSDGSPDPQGLPTVLDDEGQLWRKHPDGTLDWWIQLTTFGNVGEFDGRMDASCPSCFVRVHRSLVA